MTEDEAKTKWCPFARVSLAAGNGYATRETNRGDDFGKLCIGSACMAWRRSTVMNDRAAGEPAVPGVTAIGQLEERYSAHGFCGLAGAR